MKQSRYTDQQIVKILQQNEQGVAVANLCREHGMSQDQHYQCQTAT